MPAVAAAGAVHASGDDGRHAAHLFIYHATVSSITIPGYFWCRQYAVSVSRFLIAGCEHKFVIAVRSPIQ